MKQKHYKSVAVRLLICSALIGAVFIIHSCHKEIKLSGPPLTDSVAVAKVWYESAYLVTGASSSGSLTTSSITATPIS